jgi:hypothetical protein
MKGFKKLFRCKHSPNHPGPKNHRSVFFPQAETTLDTNKERVSAVKVPSLCYCFRDTGNQAILPECYQPYSKFISTKLRKCN